MLRTFRLAYEAVITMRKRRALERVLERLDERTLRDIGLDQEANRARERARLGIRFGAY